MCPKMHDTQREKIKIISSMDDGLSKSAKIILSKQIFNVKNP